MIVLFITVCELFVKEFIHLIIAGNTCNICPVSHKVIARLVTCTKFLAVFEACCKFCFI